MKRFLMAALVVAMVAGMALPAFGAEKATVQAETQASVGPADGTGGPIQAQTQAQVQAETQAQVGQTEDEEVEAAGDELKTGDQLRLQDGSCDDDCDGTPDQVRDRTGVEAEADVVAAGDELKIKDQLKLQDGSCDDDCDGTPDQVRDRTGVDDAISVVAESDGESDGWLAEFLYSFMETFRFMFGRV